MSEYQVDGFVATPEQVAIIEAAMAGKSFAVPAFAGTSKTATLNAIAQHQPFKKTLYLAFNKAIAQEAQALFPNWVECRTAHSLAYRYVVQPNQAMQQKLRAGGGFIPFQDIEAYANKTTQWPTFGRSRFQINLAISETLSGFCNSADTEPDASHTSESLQEWLRTLKPHEQSGFLTPLIASVRALAQAMFDEAHPCAITHDGYLKLFQLRRPQLNYQLLFLDEAQDTNQVLKALLTQQQAQKIWVGDQHQQIYTWRKASASLLGEPKQHYPLTQSFRFGQHIAELANLLLQQAGEQRVLKGLSQDYPVNTHFDPYAPYTVLCRTNAKVFEVAEFCIERKITFEINGGLDQVAKLIESAFALYQGKLAQVKVSDLAIFTSWQEFTQVADEAQKNEWKNIIKFVETHREQTLARIARLHHHCASGSRQASQVFISTVHKAKGLGFEQVLLASDFEAPEADAPDYQEQLNVLYVAITRAKKVLKLPKALNQFFAKLAEQKAVQPKSRSKKLA